MKGPNDQAEAALDTPEELRAFYDKALRVVYGYFFRRCGGVASVAEDLTQETVLAAARQIRDGKAGRDPVPWILGIARHNLIRHWRREERERRKLAVVWEAQRQTEQAMDGVELSRDQARRALESIPPSHRTVLTLRYLDGLSVPEVAATIGRSVHATESLLARGRDNFRTAYLEAERE